MSPTRRPLGSRPAGSRERSRVLRSGDHSQARCEVEGLALVLPIGVALAVGAGGDGSVLVLAPLITFALPLVVVIAFWWDGWPGSLLGRAWSGWANTVLIAIGAVVLAGLGQLVAGGLDPGALFDPSPGPGHVPAFPATMPLAGTAFIVALQLTLVGEGWPLRRLRRLLGGFAALAVSWAAALAAYLHLVQVDAPPGSDVTPRHGPVAAGDLGALLVLVGAWQVLFYVVWRGWPFVAIEGRPLRLLAAHAVVLGAGVLSYLVGHDGLGLASPRLSAVAGCFVAAGLLTGMQLAGPTPGRPRAIPDIAAALMVTVAVTAGLTLLLDAIAADLDLHRVTVDEWVQHAALNALALSIILHVAIGRRWPFDEPAAADPVVDTPEEEV